MHGDDNNPGTAEQPFATLRRAQQAVRERIAAGLDRDIKVWIRGGFYPQDEPLTFGPEDSGTEQFSITYAAHPGHRVIVSGGQAITNWTKLNANIWCALADPILGRQFAPRRFYVNGHAAIRSRSPNLAGSSPFVRTELVEINPSNQLWTIRLEPGVGTITRPELLEIVLLNHWEILRQSVRGVESRTGALQLGPGVPEPYMLPRAGVGAYLENDPAFLDQPGEWYFDLAQQRICYRPRAGENPTASLTVIPTLPHVLVVRGRQDQPVRNLHFHGLEFAHTDWQMPPFGFTGAQACFYIVPDPNNPSKRLRQEFPPAVVDWEFAEGCSIRSGWITQSGGSGIRLGIGCRDNRIVGNRIYDCAANGIMVGDNREYTDETTVARGNEVTDNVVAYVGTVFHGGVGIWVGYAQQTRVAHNLISDLPYTGISVGWLWDSRPSNCKSNLIEYNRITRVMRWLVDGGGIYTLGYQPGTIIRSNHVSDLQFSHYAAGGAVAGIYLDNGSKGFEVAGNVTDDVPLGLWVATNVHDFRWLPNLFPSAKPDGVQHHIGPPLSPAEAKEIRSQAGLQPVYRERLLGENAK
ncbi:MAG: right-handed parallel beta-helix repeat-containing protein [Verrucomicrobiae bacterium]|nr:right-handed parallel beta-helix repeat-containing protein [Verrucomicrobiae bacterium]